MVQLDKDWYLKGTIDFEYKKYILLDYIQKLKRKFQEFKLFPEFSDLKEHYNNIKSFEQLFSFEQKNLPEQLTGFDFENKVALFENKEKDNNEEIEEIQNIIEFAIPYLENLIEEGSEIYEHINNNIDYEIVGVEPTYKKEGYLITEIHNKYYLYYYKYFIEKQITFTFENVYNKSLDITPKKIKDDIIKNNTFHKNPFVFLVKAENYPIEETILPVMKEKIISSFSSF